MRTPVAELRDLDAYRRRFYVDTAACLNTYRRTIKSFALTGDFKRRRHALRLAANLSELSRRGQFNPRLSPALAQELTGVAGSDYDTFLRWLRATSPVDPFEGPHHDENLAELAATFERACV